MKKAKHRAATISVVSLMRMFPDEDTCYQWFEKARWNGKPVCPRCKSTENVSASASKPYHYWHKGCRRYFTATTGTCMHSSKTALRNWVYAIYSVMTARKGVSAMQLHKELGVQYRTAWYMLHRVREACGRSDFVLANIVEADETHIGGRERAKHADKRLNAGRGPVGKTTVAGLRERGGKVVAQPVERTDAATLTAFVEGRVKPGSTVYTDESLAYDRLSTRNYRHRAINHGAREYVRGLVSTNSIESVWALFKRSVHGTWHHVSPKHLSKYVNEATFRLNDGNCEVDTLDRMEALARQLTDSRITYADLVAENGLSSIPQQAR